MICNKKSFKLLIIGLIGITSLSNTYTPNPNFDPIKNHLKMLFCTSDDCNNLNAESKRDFNNIKNKARSNAHDSLRLMWFGLASDQEIVQETARAYVANRAYNYACSLGASYSNATEVSETIALMFKKEEYKAELRGTFSQFIGAALQYKTKKILTEIQRRENERPEPVTITQEHTEYRPSTKISTENNSCRCCLEDYIPEQSQVFLPKATSGTRSLGGNKVLFDSCGHFLCMDCTQNWFFTQNKKTCPLCNGLVDKELLQDIMSSKNKIATQEALLSEGRYNDAPEGYSYQPGAHYPEPSAPPYYDR